MTSYIDIKILHSLPFSNANRDDAGLPKTALVGGVMRGRLSSQAIKRAARFYGADHTSGFDNPTGYSRTKHVAYLIADAVKAKDPSSKVTAADIIPLVTGKDSALGATPKKGADPLTATLAVLTNGEVEALAEAYLSGSLDPLKVNDVLAKSGKKDIALWGRFFASADALTLDGAAQVSHATTTHEVVVENDFFAGMDDASALYSDHAGAGHPGDQHFLSGTFFKYANINIDELVINLLAPDPSRSVEDVTADTLSEIAGFIRQFVLSVPQGKIRATAHTTLPSFVRVSQRPAPVNLGTAFDSPVTGSNIMRDSVECLLKADKTSEFFHPTRSATTWVDPTLEDVSVESDVDSFEALLDKVIESAREDVEAAAAKYRKD